MRQLCILFSVLIIFYFYACKDDNIDDKPKDISVNQWIENTMRENYYWYEEIPTSDKLNFGSEPEAFFKSMLSDKDGKARYQSSHHYYSVIQKTSNTTRRAADNALSLGFEYQNYYFTNQNTYGTKVLYILPDSPASRSELRRGDWIFSINNEPLNLELLEKLQNGENVTLGISETLNSPISKIINLTPQYVIDNPVYVDTTYNINGRKIGYLVYNHFTSGIVNDDSFNNSLRKAFSNFNKEVPDEFILDLRYNGGGLVSSSQLLATMLAPTAALDDIFCRITYNNKKSSADYDLKFDTKIMKKGSGGENINTKRLFVITSSRTASASEAVINGLKPFLGNDLIIIGERTEGKNVGSLTYSDSRFGWELHPIVCGISNKDYFSDYSSGFAPDFEYSDSNYEKLYDLGNTDERILKWVLNLILYNETTTSTRSSINENLVSVGSSLDRKNTNGVILSE